MGLLRYLQKRLGFEFAIKFNLKFIFKNSALFLNLYSILIRFPVDGNAAHAVERRVF